MALDLLSGNNFCTCCYVNIYVSVLPLLFGRRHIYTRNAPFSVHFIALHIFTPTIGLSANLTCGILPSSISQTPSVVWTCLTDTELAARIIDILQRQSRISATNSVFVHWLPRPSTFSTCFQRCYFCIATVSSRQTRQLNSHGMTSKIPW